MRLLILSEYILREQQYGKVPFNPPYDVVLDVGDLNDSDNFNFSVFDYDVAIIHIIDGHPEICFIPLE